MKKVYGIMLILLVISVSSISLRMYQVEASPKTWTVDDDRQECPDADFTKIQDAVTAATSGDVILVYPGMYIEKVVITKSIVVMSESGPNVTIVKCLDPQVNDTFRVQANYVQINGFTIERIVSMLGVTGYGVHLQGNNTHILNNIFMGNGSAICMESSSFANLIENNTFVDCPNGITYGSCALGYFYGTIIQHNIFLNCGTGVNLYAQGDIVRNNFFYENDYGVRLDFGANTVVENIFRNCGIMTIYTTHVIENNTVNDKPIYYFKNITDIIVPTDGGQVIIVNCVNVTVRDINASASSIGIILADTNNSIIENNICSNNIVGLYLFHSNNNTIKQNTFSVNEKGISLLVNSERNCIFNNTVSMNTDGLYLSGSSYIDGGIKNNIITDNTMALNVYGIRFYSGYYDMFSNNAIKRNVLSNNTYGICITSIYGPYYTQVFYNNIEQNIIRFNQYGLVVTNVRSGFNDISLNDINNNLNGLYLWSFDNNIISQNNITTNQIGIYFYRSSNNTIFHNNFIDNAQQTYCNESSNTWNDAYPNGGNYWSDYVGIDEKSGPNQDQPGSDGIGDTPYVINENNTDRYPLMEPISPPTYKFMVGDVIWATTDLHVREGPGLSYAILDTMRKGNRGVIIGGPMEADGYAWWRVNYSVGVVGWSAEDWLELMPDPPQPPRGFVYWAEAAVNWAEQRLGRGDWSGLCMRFVANAFMQEEHKEAGYNAIDGAREYYRFNQEPNGWLQAPKGALIFFDMEGTNEYGHVGIYLGNGSIIHAYGTVKVNTVEEAISKPDVGRYLGWSYPPEQWRPTKFTFNATYDGVNYPVTVFTNSTIMDFAFHQPSKQISFTVYGETGETGYCNITIPKALLKGEPWTITLNGTNWSYIATENETHSFVYITYSFSSICEITIEGTWVIPEFPSIPVMLLMLTTLTAVILSRRRKARH